MQKQPPLLLVDRLYKRHVETNIRPLSYLAFSIKLALQS